MTARHDIVFFAPETLPATIDATRLEQVLANLLDNAIKFSPKGGRIDVSLSRHGDTVRIEVRDHGIGIPEHERQRVFERFHQAHPDEPRAGLGLGLYVSRQIIERHAGRITAEAPDDGGARIVIELPGIAIDTATALVTPEMAR
jgi:signal transduction histidine kinase